MLYCTYDTLNMFQALLCPSSGALDYMYAIAGCASRKRDAAASLFLDAHPASLHLTPTVSSQALHTIGGNSIHIV